MGKSQQSCRSNPYRIYIATLSVAFNSNFVQFSAALPEMVECLVLIEGFGYLTAPRVGNYICFMFTQFQNIHTHSVCKLVQSVNVKYAHHINCVCMCMLVFSVV